MTYTFVGMKHNLSATKVMRIFDSHVSIDRKPLPKVLSMDEHYFPESNYDSLYCCLLMNFITGELVDVLPDRKKDYLISYFGNIRNKTLKDDGISKLNNVEYVSIDLYDNYREIAKTYFTSAKICANPFHVLKNLTDAFGKVRTRCRRNTKDENMQYLLVKFRKVFNHNVELDNEPKYNKRFKRKMNLKDIQELMFKNFPELKKAYDLKESYIIFNETSNIDNEKELIADQIKAFGNSDIKEYENFYNLLINWNQEIVN
ncbi:MAG: transposase [Traorella sp.]